MDVSPAKSRHIPPSPTDSSRIPTFLVSGTTREHVSGVRNRQSALRNVLMFQAWKRRRLA